MNIKKILTFVAGTFIPAIEWAKGDFLSQYTHEFQTFLSDPDIAGGVTGALSDMKNMPISTIVQYLGLGNELVARIANKNFLGGFRDDALYLALGTFIMRIVMYGSHSSPAIVPVQPRTVGPYST